MYGCQRVESISILNAGGRTYHSRSRPGLRTSITRAVRVHNHGREAPQRSGRGRKGERAGGMRRAAAGGGGIHHRFCVGEDLMFLRV